MRKTKLMGKLIKLRLNGEEWELEIEPHRTLLEVLREDLGLTGTKEGCGLGACGACTVLVDGLPALACLTPVMGMENKDILTIEGLARNGEPHPLQVAFVEHGAIQCGFCTPGTILSAKALLDRQPHPNHEEIREAISGNLCRCTGYKKIISAIESLIEE